MSWKVFGPVIALLLALPVSLPAVSQQTSPQLSLPGIEPPPMPPARPQQLQLPLTPGRPQTPENSPPDLDNSADSVLGQLGRDIARSSGAITGLGLGILDTIEQSGTCNTFDERLQRALMNAEASILSDAGGMIVGGLLTSALGGNDPGLLSKSVGDVAGKVVTHKLNRAMSENIENYLRSRFSNDEVLAYQLCKLTQAGETVRDAFERAFDLRFAERCNLRIAEVDSLGAADFEERFACAYRDRADRAALDGMIDDVFQANLIVCRAGLSLIRELAPNRLRVASGRPETLGCDSNEDVTRTWQAYLDGRTD
ncbi:hypothetical protein WNZ15_23980 [Roseibium sp. AS2]|uniref:hypothetical protein n=1 Tax=Roseibium sp. AS2 TaxID=3135781 RepID=UPI00316B29E5